MIFAVNFENNLTMLNNDMKKKEIPEILIENFEKDLNLDINKVTEFIVAQSKKKLSIVEEDNKISEMLHKIAIKKNWDYTKLFQSSYHYSDIVNLAKWNLVKHIYKFNSFITNQLENCLMLKEIPFEQITSKFPSLVIFIDFKINNLIHGFFANVVHDKSSSKKVLCLTFICDVDGELMRLSIEIVGSSVNFSSVEKPHVFNGDSRVLTKKDPRLPIEKKEVPEILNKAINALLFICTNEPDVTREYKESDNHRDKKLVRIFRDKKLGLAPPKNPRIHTIGNETEKNVAESMLGSKGKAKKPHIRKAHWHLYWKGKKSEGKEGVYRFIPMLYVNVD